MLKKDNDMTKSKNNKGEEILVKKKKSTQFYFCFSIL